MRKPTDISELYPDPYGHFDELDDKRINRIVKWTVRVITTFIAIGFFGFCWTTYQQFFN